MRKYVLLAPILVGLAIAAAVLVACGSGGDEDNGGSASPSMPTAAPAAGQEVTLRAGERSENDYYFEAKEFTVRPGSVRLTLSNVGPERPHSLEIKNMAGDQSVAKIDRVEVGQSAMVEFAVTQPGTYQIVCNIRGHIDRGMTGTMTVRAQ